MTTPQPSPTPPIVTERYLAAFWHIRQTFMNQLSVQLENAYQVDMRQYMALQFVQRGIVYPTDLAEAMSVPGYMSSRIIESLLDKALIQRQIDKSDARRIILTLTVQGKERLADCNQAMTTELDRLLARLDSAHRILLLEILEVLAAREEA